MSDTVNPWIPMHTLQEAVEQRGPIVEHHVKALGPEFLQAGGISRNGSNTTNVHRNGVERLLHEGKLSLKRDPKIVAFGSAAPRLSQPAQQLVDAHGLPLPKRY